MRGQGSIMIGILFLSTFLLSIIPLTLHMYNTSINRTPVYENPVHKITYMSMKGMSRDIIAFFNASSSILEVVNMGGEDMDIESIILLTICNADKVYINTKTSTIIRSGQAVFIQIPISQTICIDPRPKTLHIITRKGAIISATVITSDDLELITRPILNITTPVALTKSITILPIRLDNYDTIWNISILQQKGFEIYTLNNINNPTRLQSYTDLSKGMRGGTTTIYTWELNRVSSSISISINGQTIRNLWLGYDPRNTSKYNMIITADSITINLGGSSRSYSNNVRIKIYGFRPTTSQGILQLGSTWITRPSQDVADYTFLTTTTTTTRLTLNGIADRVEIYTRTTGGETGYNPYTLFMNTDKSQRFSGILFTSIDRIWGSYNSRNEGHDSLIDYSTIPLVLVYKDYVISNTEYSAIAIAVNYRFHDNEGSDAQGTSIDKPIMFIGLVDENNVIYAYRSYTFRELTRYEDTYPPTAQAQSSIFFVPLPPKEVGEKRFYAFIAIQDPYHYDGNLDDLDFTLYIESLTLIPMS